MTSEQHTPFELLIGKLLKELPDGWHIYSLAAYAHPQKGDVWTVGIVKDGSQLVLTFELLGKDALQDELFEAIALLPTI